MRWKKKLGVTTTTTFFVIPSYLSVDRRADGGNHDSPSSHKRVLEKPDRVEEEGGGMELTTIPKPTRWLAAFSSCRSAFKFTPVP